MKTFRYVLYGKIIVRLSSFLHIGGADDDNFSLASDGGGNFIIPASSIAGAVKAYLKDKPEELRLLAGDEKNESRIYYYDALCKGVNIEERKGIRIEGRYGVCQSGALYTRCVIGRGAEAEIELQIFAEDSEKDRRNMERVFDEISAGIGSGEISFGAYKSVGSGVFELVKSGKRILDLWSEKEFEEYISGVKENMAFVSLAAPQTGMFSLKEKDGKTSFKLTAEIPQGILVGGGEANENSDLVNMSESGGSYYIPGATVKGFIRGYAERVANTFEIPCEKLVKMFGGEYEGKKYRSHLATADVLLSDVKRVVFDRIKVNPWTCDVVGSAKMDYEVLFTKKNSCIAISVVTDMGDTEEGRLLNAFVFLALRDLGLGFEAMGSLGSIGLGRFRGNRLEAAGYSSDFDNGKLDFEEGGREIIERWLKEVERYAL